MGAFRYDEARRHKAAQTLQNGVRAWRYRARGGGGSGPTVSVVPWVPWAVQLRIIKIQSALRDVGGIRTLPSAEAPAARRGSGRLVF